MRTLTSTLQAEQKKASRTPCVKAAARNLLSGVVNLKWERLYSGAEADSPLALTLPGDGSLVRLMVTPTEDGRQLYRQRVTSPGPGSDFSQWTSLNQYNVMAVAACSLGMQVSLFWIKSSGEIDLVASDDGGAGWQDPVYPGYAATGTGVTAAAAACRPDGDLALFFTDASSLYLIRRAGGVWQTRVAWDKSTGSLSGVAAVYDGDWKLLVSGQDTGGDFKVWSLIYGDGGEVAPGTWSGLKEIASAPAGGNFRYQGLFLDKPSPSGAFRGFFSEIFAGEESYNRPFQTHTLPGTPFLENRWKEPAPFEAESGYGPAAAHDSNYVWLSTPSAVWRAGLAEETLELSGDILAASLKLGEEGEELILELRNDDGQYAGPGQGPLSTLDTGCRIDISPGYRTSAGEEVSSGLSFTLEGFELTRGAGSAALVLYACGGWKALEGWTARCQLRWNKEAEEASVKEILAQVLARTGIKLEVKSQSSDINGLYPDFTLQAGDGGKAAVARLLSFVPDLLFLEGNTAYLVNPLDTDPPLYVYGPQAGTGGTPGHVMLEGRYRKNAWKINRVLVEGLDPAGGTPVLAWSADWDEIQKSGDRLETVEDINLDTAARAYNRGLAHLRKTAIQAVAGRMRVPVNCGQQLYDVLEVNDPGAGLTAARRRVLGISLSYLPRKGEYEQGLLLGGV